jgi:hypothetical protein
LLTEEPVAGFRAHLQISPCLQQPTVPATPYNGPGRIDRPDRRAPGILREDAVQPLKLGHVVIGSTDRPRGLPKPHGTRRQIWPSPGSAAWSAR